jgi:short subunit dehydrogenase-like uncharacterized protein
MQRAVIFARSALRFATRRWGEARQRHSVRAFGSAAEARVERGRTAVSCVGFDPWTHIGERVCVNACVDACVDAWTDEWTDAWT